MSISGMPYSWEAALASLAETDWEMVEGRDAIRKSYRFRSFAEAWGWMSRIAIEADKLDHHPEWTNVYNRVEVVLTTHDAKGLTALDVRLAGQMDAAAPSRG